MATARRHHYVSQFYLKNFVLDRNDPMLYVVDLQLRKSFRTSPANVAAQRDFHTITTPGYEPDFVEKQIFEIEGSVAAALADIIEREYVGRDEIAQLVSFYMALLLVKSR